MTTRSLYFGILLVVGIAACSSTPATGTSGGTTAASTTTTGSTSAGSSTGGSSTGGTSTGGTTGGMPDAGCTCDAGYCDPLGSATCLNCLTDAQCTAPKAHCQTSPTQLHYGDCVVCSSQAQCPVGEVCDLSLGSTFQQCVTDCRIDAGIPPCPNSLGQPQHCVPATGTCSIGCALDIDCGVGGGRCDVDAGVCVPCLTSADCPYSNAGCNAQFEQCGSCITTADCPTGLSCVVLYAGPPPQSQCVCLNDSQCGGNAPVCLNTNLVGDGDGGSCGCNTSADCAAQGGVCQQGNGALASCFASCVDGGTDCKTFPAPNQYCTPSTGLCGRCIDDAQCAGDSLGTHCGPRGTCGCLASSDCASADQVCSDAYGQCVPSCLLDAGATNCVPNGQICNPANGQCVYCLSDSDCVAGNGTPYCSSDIDAGNSCVQCFTPADCPDTSPGCNAGSYFCGYCTQPSDCPTSAPLCNQGSCVASCVLGDGGTDCDSGVCQTDTGFCVGCLSDIDCQSQPNAPFCGTDVDAGNYCVQCLSQSDCPADSIGCSSQAYFCGSCAVSSDCPPSQAYCQYGICGDSCVLPDGGQSCPYGVCDTSAGTCVGCLTDTDCQAFGQFALYCLADVDAGNNCAQCIDASQCAPWPCNTTYYFCGSCGSDADCPSEAPHCATPPNGNCTDAG